MNRNKFFAVAAFLVSSVALASQHVSKTDTSISFDTMDKAAQAAIMNIYEISDKIEYAGFIVQKGDVFYYTLPFTNYSDDHVNPHVAVSIPKGSKIVGYYHNHPKINIRTTVRRGRDLGETFSDHDTTFANMRGFVAYVGIVKNQTILRYNPETKITVEVN